MGPKDRREREKLETREKILEAARDMFAEAGFEAVTMRAIADRIEYTPTAIYHHFENKQALATELCHMDFRSLASHFNRAVRVEDPVLRIWEIGLAYLEFAERFPNQYRFMFMTRHPDLVHTPEYLAEVHGNPEEDAYAFLRQACADAIARGRFRSDFSDADEFAQILWGMIHGLISLRIVKDHNWVAWRDLRTSARHAMEAMYRGLLREPDSFVAPQPSEAAASGS